MGLLLDLTPEQAEKLDGFADARHSEWRQSTEDWTDPKTGEFFPATYNWCSFIGARRISDGVDFFVRIWIKGEKDKPMDTASVPTMLDAAIDQMRTYRDCDCKVGNPCSQHKENTDAHCT